MSEKDNTHVWHSGDWRLKPYQKPPYNGIEISAKPIYSKNDEFISVEVVFTDFTLSETGLSSTIPELQIQEKWVPIPEVVLTSSSPEEIDPDFTIKGSVALSREPTGIYMQIQLRYGLEHSQREELGFILRFDSVKMS